jgi:hypothetical protein
LITAFDEENMTSNDLMTILNLKHKEKFRLNYILPALQQGFIERTIPDKPNSRFQKYQLTDKGKAVTGK